MGCLPDGMVSQEQGKINLEESGYIADLIGELRLKDWVAFIEGPPLIKQRPTERHVLRTRIAKK